VIVAHLGSGASMCALSGGRSVESTMGFTALDGLPMGTRPGQIDPGVVLYLVGEKQMTAAQTQNLLYGECGLKGLSGISSDVRELEASPDPQARFALEQANAAGASGAVSIAAPESRVGLYVVATDEELMIARHTLALLTARRAQPALSIE
jgi:acetate kinase